MKIERLIATELLKWKNASHRKPLILRGARQVGKTTLIHRFAKGYKHRILLNLELQKDKSFFTDFQSVQTIVEALCISRNIPTDEKKHTLLFIDEIQESPEAIALLRYFYEMEPEIHVIAAGSLLEHAMKKVKSFPVGRITILYLFPINFVEFLSATGSTSILEQLNNIPINETAHKTTLDLFNRYAIIGGMPEVVSKYVETKSISDLPAVYESIWETYKEDVIKYASNNTEARIIRHIMSTAHLVMDSRIKFQNFGNSNYRSREVGEAFRNLDDAKVIQLIYPTTNTSPPLLPDLKKSPRLQFLDTGLINHELNIQGEMLAMHDLNDAYRGAIIPHLVAQELMSLNANKNSKPVFWVREKNQSSAEVDLLVHCNQMIIPIEIKSGKEGKLKSLHQFIEEASHPYAVRMYAGKFSIERHTTRSGKSYLLMNLPYYLSSKLFDYLNYFTTHYKID
jgi:predicted AAA+ superfamily ATPase